MTQEKGIPYQRHKPSAALREFLDPLDPGSYFDCGRARLHGLDDALLKEAESRGRRIGDDSFQLVATDMGLIFCRPSISFAIAARWEDLMLIRPKGDDPVVLSVTWPTHGELKFTLSKRLAGNVFRRWLQLRMQAARQARSQESRFAREDHPDSTESGGWEVVTEVDPPTRPEPKDPAKGSSTGPLRGSSTASAVVRDRRAERSARREQLQRQGERRRRAEPISASAARTGFDPSDDEPDERRSRSWRSTAAPTTQMARPLPAAAPVLERQGVDGGVLTADDADEGTEHADLAPAPEPDPAPTAGPEVVASDSEVPSDSEMAPEAHTEACDSTPTAESEEASASTPTADTEGAPELEVAPDLEVAPEAAPNAEAEAPPIEVVAPEPTDWPQPMPSDEELVIDLAKSSDDGGGEENAGTTSVDDLALADAALSDEPSDGPEPVLSDLEWTSDADAVVETGPDAADDRSLEPAIRPVPVPRTTPTSWVGSPFSFVATVVVLSTFVLIAVAAVSSYRRAVGEGEGSGVAPASPSVTRTTIDHRRFQLGSTTSATITSEVVATTTDAEPADQVATPASPSSTDGSPEVAEEQPPQLCNSNYSGCVPTAEDVDCPGDGDGPAFSVEPAVVMGRDVYELDTDGDGETCEPDQPRSSATGPGAP